MTNREKWAKILPIIQAFVDGKPIQCKDYGGRWVTADSIYSAMSNYDKYRLTPPDMVQGIWSVDYEYVEPGSVNGVVHTGTMQWEATNEDAPPWPTSRGYKIFLGTEKFVPKDEP